MYIVQEQAPRDEGVVAISSVCYLRQVPYVRLALNLHLPQSSIESSAWKLQSNVLCPSFVLLLISSLYP